MSPPAKVLVVGAGAVGLRTAVELMRRKLSVMLEAPTNPITDPSVCSLGSGGKWGPVHCQDPRVDRWAIQTLDELWPLGLDPADDRVEILPVVYLRRHHGGPTVDEFSTDERYYEKPGAVTESVKLPRWTRDPRLEFQHLTVEMLAWQNIAAQLRIPPESELREAKYDYAWMYKTAVVDPKRMMQDMIDQLSSQADDADAIRIGTGVHFESLEHMVDHARSRGCQALVNCTGLAASQLVGDAELQGGRGVTLQFDRHAERRLPVQEGPFGRNRFDAVLGSEDPPWAPSKDFPTYLIPRGNIIIVGGSFLLGDSEIGIRDEERDHLLRTAERFGIDLQASPPIGEWTGFRPWRPTLRCELDPNYMSDTFRVCHNYGHGGSGWTINVGTAMECADLLVEGLPR
jgi:D-amino-acid oxidase